LVLVMACGMFAAAAQPGVSTVWDGVYTPEQATRGERFYRQRCTKCHRNDLSGDGALQGQLGEIVPSLVGISFSSRWNDMTVGDMSLTIGRTMPWDAPGTLTRQANVDIVSYLLKMNDIPAGTTELPVETAKLHQILITPKPAK
jgi:cytochrome c